MRLPELWVQNIWFRSVLTKISKFLPPRSTDVIATGESKPLGHRVSWGSLIETLYDTRMKRLERLDETNTFSTSMIIDEVKMAYHDVCNIILVCLWCGTIRTIRIVSPIVFNLSKYVRHLSHHHIAFYIPFNRTFYRIFHSTPFAQRNRFRFLICSS